MAGTGPTTAKATATAPPAALSMQGMVKTFGAVRALDGANLTVRRGTIHGLVGQNGAGKSTIIKILAGIYRPDQGSIEIGGHRHDHLTPRLVDRLGVGFIHQERLLVPSFTVGEALFLGAELGFGRLPLLNRRRMQREAAEVLRRYFDVEFPPDALISELTSAQQQIVQITRALLSNPSVLVFDEPTAALAQREVARLFGIIRRLKDMGISIVYISHYLQEIEALCDRVTVLRNGVDVGTVEPRTTPTATIVAMMVARDIREMFPKRSASLGDVVMKVDSLGRDGAFDGVSLELRRGEVVGLTGLLGSGAKELVRCLYGLDRPDRGSIEIEGKAVSVRSPAQAVGRHLAMVPEDRRSFGAAMSLTVRENITLASLDRYSRLGVIGDRQERRGVDQLIERLAIRADGRDAAVRKLSGGNQQKVVLAKWLSCRSSIYLLDEPTVAIDIGSKVEIYRLMGELAEQGAAILILSSDLMELIGICDRVLVMYRGRIAGAFDAGRASSDDLLACATGARSAA